MGNAAATIDRSRARSPTATARALSFSMIDRPLGPGGPDALDEPHRGDPSGEADASPRRKVRAPSAAGEAADDGYRRRRGAARGRRSERERPDRARAWAIVVNWNGAHLLPASLAALAAQTVPVRILVVDNGSTDGSDALVAGHAGVEWLPLGRNAG